DVAARLAEVLGPRRQAAAADLVGGLPHRVALEALDLGDLPAEERAVELGGPPHVADRDVDVGDVSVRHTCSLMGGWGRTIDQGAGGCAATSGVSTPTGPSAAAPPGEPSGSSRPGRVSKK